MVVVLALAFFFSAKSLQALTRVSSPRAMGAKSSVKLGSRLSSSVKLGLRLSPTRLDRISIRANR